MRGKPAGPAWIRCWRPSASAITSVWAGESYGTDAVTPIAWVLARTAKDQGGHRHHADVGAHTDLRRDDGGDAAGHVRQPLSSGIGPSGPQVIEGWHGMPYGKPLTRTREYIEIVRKVFAREAPLQHKGEHYQIPYAGADATGLGKPLKSILHPDPTSRSTRPRSRLPA